ncbi:hypothetical protein EUGRSUZ_I02124 [Eucalyptus grandis]|uniref:Uncharacterized protein n=2 Tax=Eucalyptus grandis TaxID=71139 RepID=A0ACC3JJ91_EUCGR|nr:hypothetical protein EUGRSUZ_I02124 [Eucalyptus grandis]
MRKTLVLVCALFISFALLFLPSIEARALLQKGPVKMPPCTGRKGRYTPCIPSPSPPCSVYARGPCPPLVGPTEP